MAPHSNRKLSKRRSSGRDNYLTKIKGKKPFSVSEFVGSRVSNASKKAINYINKDFMNKASKTKKKLQRKKTKGKKKTRKRIYHGSGYWTSKNCGNGNEPDNSYLKSYETPKYITFYNINLLELVTKYNDNQVKKSGEKKFKELNEKYSKKDDYHYGNWRIYTEKMDKLIKSLNNEKYTNKLVKVRFSVLKKASDKLIKGLKRLKGYKTLPKITNCSNRIEAIEIFFNELEGIFKSDLKKSENLWVRANESNPSPGAPDHYFGTSYILEISRYQELVMEFFKELQRSHNSS